MLKSTLLLNGINKIGGKNLDKQTRRNAKRAEEESLSETPFPPQIMQRQPRGDLQASLPVLKKLDALLIDTMDTLINQEFSYKSAPRTVTSSDVLDAYWRPKAVVPTGGLSPEALRKLRGQKEVVTNIYAVAMAINAQTLAEMAIPDEYWESLPRVST